MYLPPLPFPTKNGVHAGLCVTANGDFPPHLKYCGNYEAPHIIQFLLQIDRCVGPNKESTSLINHSGIGIFFFLLMSCYNPNIAT